MSEQYGRLRGLLDELFQFDRADLDFGIYRVMNRKRAEVSRFLEHDLLPQVREALGVVESAEREGIEGRLTQLKIRLEEDGVAYESSTRFRELQAELAATADLDAVEREVYDDLYTFFRRYYKDGDFISQRRYKDGVYAIPYAGEEVKLHWANADQYYVKTAESFRDYRFALPDGRRVHFRLSAAETERDNNKAESGRERRFVLRGEEPVAVSEGKLSVYFEYRALDERKPQKALNAEAMERLPGLPEIAGWRAALCEPQPTAGNGSRTLLEKRLGEYTARNTFDYFIHKDLGGFLERELDFYLKNEVLRIDDLDAGDEQRAGRTLARLRAIRQIGRKIIAFLAQLEDFQKRLWLKKKFVVETGWCVTLDRVPEALYPEIAASEAQREEWVRLFAIDGIRADTVRAAGYTEPLTVEFLRENPHLVLDTRFFGREFVDALLGSFEDLDAATDGLLMNAENFQALRLVRERYDEQVKCIYIDPPYNTGSDEFVYKDNYRHSSWLSMMGNRLAVAQQLMERRAVISVSTDDGEYATLKLLLQSVMGEDNFVNDIIWQSRKSVSSDTLVSLAHNHTTMFARDRAVLNAEKACFRLPMDESGFSNPDNDPRGPWKADPFDAPNIRPNLTYTIINPNTGQEYTPPQGRCWRTTPEEYARLLADNRIVFGRRGTSGPQLKRFLSEAQGRGDTPTTIWNDVGTTTHGTDLLEAMMGSKTFNNPKPVDLLERICVLPTDRAAEDLVLDYFAGSGTTGHAVINLNREDGGNRKYILVEMGEYFDTVLKPRIQKVIYSKDWRDGKPVSREGSSHVLKYIRLESYEDALNNLEDARPDTIQGALEQHAGLREEYLLKYMLELDTKGSPSLLDLRGLETPFEYRLRVARGGETAEAAVDLVETFNWLLGLRVRRMRTVDGFRTVEGVNPEGERVLVIWRNPREERHDNAALERFFLAQGYGDRPEVEALDRVYVNGDNTLGRLRGEGERWRTLLIEEEFQRLMFAAPGEGGL